MIRNDLKNYKENISTMSSKELDTQIKLNKKRMVGNAMFFSGVTISSLFVCPPVAVIHAGIDTIRLYWIHQNNKTMNKQLTLTKNK